MPAATGRCFASIPIFAEFLTHELIVIEFLIGQIQAIGGRAVGPSRGFVRAALWTGAGSGRQDGAAMRT